MTPERTQRTFWTTIGLYTKLTHFNIEYVKSTIVRIEGLEGNHDIWSFGLWCSQAWNSLLCLYFCFFFEELRCELHCELFNKNNINTIWFSVYFNGQMSVINAWNVTFVAFLLRNYALACQLWRLCTKQTRCLRCCS